VSEAVAGPAGRERPRAQVTTEHILLGLVAEDTQSRGGYLNSGLSAERAKAAVEAANGKRRPNTSADNIPFSREVRRTFEAATNVGAAAAGAHPGSGRFDCRPDGRCDSWSPAGPAASRAPPLSTVRRRDSRAIGVRLCSGASATAGEMFLPIVQECRKYGVNFVSPEHITLALLHVPDTLARQALERCGAPRRPPGCGCSSARSTFQCSQQCRWRASRARRLGIDTDVLKTEALRRLNGEREAEQPKKKRAVRGSRLRALRGCRACIQLLQLLPGACAAHTASCRQLCRT
jgi:hypothetical protein